MLDKEAIEKIKDDLVSKKQTIAVVESVTAGLLQHALSSAIDASKFFQGGLTPYNIGQKCRHLSVDPIHAIECDCVSQKMAEIMAIECCRFFTSDWGVSITGYASPTPESKNKLYAFYALAFNGEIQVSEKIESEDNAPYDVQLHYRDRVIEKLLEKLKG